MGQAKSRGDFQNRVAQARQRAAELRPEKLVCNNCKTGITEFESLDSRGLSGVKAVFAGRCPSCGQTTMGGVGDRKALETFFSAFAEFSGIEGTSSIQKL